MSRRSVRSKRRAPARRAARQPPRRAVVPASQGPTPRPTPREFLRERRPYLFSDSSRQTRPRLDRAFLEYFISRLTSRSQEADFETFARRLCEHEVCPNLLPHTGPTGGGDSKVDSETYPVSLDIADSWYIGEARAAAAERWAFAFSAKADWRSKLRSDIVKMAGTGRGYARYYFVTSQYVPDRTRADLEDDYRNNQALDVRILDLNWLLEKVFTGGHEELAVQSLHIDVELAPEQRLGPNDAERAAREAEYEEQIAAALKSGQIGPRTVGLALESAVISRESERPRSEVEGKLDRAARLAADHGFTSQQRSVAYQRAWTAYWWLEDGSAFSDFAQQYEAQVRGTRNAFELERLANLYMCARVGIGDRWQANEEWLTERLTVLNEELNRLSSVEIAPSAALNARVTKLVVQLSTRPEAFEETLRRLNEALEAATGLAGFGFEPLADLVSELGTVIPQSAEFDALHERLVQQVQQRTGDVAAGEMHLQRAVQLYRAERRPEAITAAGRALPLLAAEESRGQLLRTLDLIGECYLAIGLPWAARGSWLMAASLAGSDAEGFGRGFPRLVVVLDRLRSVELRLGRLPESLAIHRLYRLVASVAARDDESIQDEAAEADVAYELVLANALLNLDEAAAGQLIKLPDFLGTQDLPVARAALLFVLGHEATLPEWLGVPSGGERHFLSNLRAARGGVNLKIDVGHPDEGLLETRVLGVRIQTQFEGGSPAKETAESLLAAIESLLATAAGRGFFGFVPLVVIHVRPGHFTEFPWRVVDGTEGGPIEAAVARFDPSQLTAAQQGQIHEALVAAVARIIPRGFHIDVPEETLPQLLGEEGALARASNFTGSFVTAGDLYDGLKSGLDGLLSGEELAYPPTGNVPTWDEVVRNESPSPRAPDEDSTGGPPELGSVRHDEMRVESVIDVPVWDRARWKGLGFFVDPHGPPIVALMFTNASAASTIWRQWQQTFGKEDAAARLRFSIVTDVDPRDRFTYRVVVGPAPEAAFDGGARIVFSIARVHEMNPTSDANLRAFRAEYERQMGCHLAVAVMPPGGMDISQSKILGTVYLSRIRFVAAKDVSEHDLEVVALRDRG